MLAAQILAPAFPVFPLAALPSAPVTTSTTAFYLAANPHQGVRSSVTTWQLGLLPGNPQKALGLPVCLYDSGRRSRDTGKERDSETNLDYFGARYFSGAQGRFTSPDAPLLDQHILDPQSWNLYTYGRNNPLRYVDPTGQAIELIGDEDERKRALALLASSVGKAGANLYINSVKDGDNTRYFVGVNGSLNDFAKMGSGAAGLADVIGAKPVVEFGITDGALPGKGQREAAYTYAPGEIGNQNVRVLVNPGKVNDASIAFSTNGLLRNKFDSGVLRDTTPAIAAFHEFGHVWSMWQDIQARGSAIPGASGIEIGTASGQRALQWENRIRESLYGPLGPNNARRIQH
jgi:RHS repeat-associated protein